jgi:hypothetical protein
VVSTVGSYIPPGTCNKPSEIGYHRYYETMAFPARWIDPYWEADTTVSEIPFKSQRVIDHCECGTDSEANMMHEAVVTEFITEMEEA